MSQDEDCAKDVGCFGSEIGPAHDRAAGMLSVLDIITYNVFILKQKGCWHFRQAINGRPKKTPAPVPLRVTVRLYDGLS